jgi:RNA polymerase sigma-70 factor (ECF subfamily)
MNDSDNLYAVGRFDARYLAFLETIATLRPSLHRYCARMTGSVSEGEDVVQESLFHAYRKLDTYDDQRPLKAWLFRIAHNRCIDVLRRREVREGTEAAAGAAGPVVVDPVEPLGPALGRAVEHLVVALPPKERACVLLKDVLDYSLEEIAELVDSTVGGVKAALNRGRSKLASLPKSQPLARPMSAQVTRLLHLYVDRFNSRDWNGLRDLIAADARICVADRFAGQLSDSPYFATYQQMQDSRRATIADIDGELGVIVLHRIADAWSPHAVVHLDIVGDRVARVADYGHCSWVIAAIDRLVLLEPLTLEQDNVI